MANSGFNLPDGVFESDLPGNRPRDVAWDHAVEELSEDWAVNCSDHEDDCDCALVHRQEVDDEGEFVLCMKLITRYDPATKSIVLWGRGGTDPSECHLFEDHVEARVEEMMER